jgi:predicted unusual protein kinase regulating ubiquinone biosynthesis (AarF/ABC1/UbiB family)
MHKRARKAYILTFGILFSYLRLFLFSKVFGQKYWDRRISKLHQKSALKIKKTLLELKGLFIKVGQLISILSNVLPEEFREPLESLQDQLPPRDYSEIKTTIEAEFGKPVESVFQTFDSTPLAAASIGQTHRATLKDGSDVVVKVQHMGIEKIAKIDLSVIQNLVKMISRFYSIKGMDHLYTQVRKMIQEELDYELEANSMFTIGENLKEEKQVFVPKLFRDYSTKKVITSAFCDGVKISNIKQLDEWGIDRTELAERFVSMYCKMIFEEDVFHADPHPGNILVSNKGDIYLLDFGAVTSLKPEMKTGLPEMIVAFTKNDTEGIVKAMKKMGFVGSGKDAQKLAEKLIDMGQEFLQNEIQIDSLNLDGIKIDPDSNIIGKVLNTINFKEMANTFQVPKDWILLQRVMLLVLGTSNQLAPKLNPAEIVQPYIQKIVLGKKGSITSFIIDAVKNQASTLLALPADLKKTLQKANKDGLEVNFESLNRNSKLISNALQQLVFAILTIAAVYFANFYSNNGDIKAFNFSRAAGIVFFILFLRYYLTKKK